MLVLYQFCFEGFLVVSASCPRERDAHTTTRHFYLDRILAATGVSQKLDTQGQPSSKGIRVICGSIKQGALSLSVRVSVQGLIIC